MSSAEGGNSRSPAGTAGASGVSASDCVTPKRSITDVPAAFSAAKMVRVMDVQMNAISNSV